MKELQVTHPWKSNYDSYFMNSFISVIFKLTVNSDIFTVIQIRLKSRRCSNVWYLSLLSMFPLTALWIDQIGNHIAHSEWYDVLRTPPGYDREITFSTSFAKEQNWLKRLLFWGNNRFLTAFGIITTIAFQSSKCIIANGEHNWQYWQCEGYIP